MNTNNVASAYNQNYRTPDFFNDKGWLYRSFIAALVRKAGLVRGAKVLDAGCGQGFFASLLAEKDLDVLGVDLSDVGI